MKNVRSGDRLNLSPGIMSLLQGKLAYDGADHAVSYPEGAA